jgi:O-succinylbenzoate synthase
LKEEEYKKKIREYKELNLQSKIPENFDVTEIPETMKEVLGNAQTKAKEWLNKFVQPQKDLMKETNNSTK